MQTLQCEGSFWLNVPFLFLAYNIVFTSYCVILQYSTPDTFSMPYMANIHTSPFDPPTQNPLEP